MDPIYEAMHDAHAIAVGSPIYFDAVSAQLKLVIDRSNCITPLLRVPVDGRSFRALWPRTRARRVRDRERRAAALGHGRAQRARIPEVGGSEVGGDARVAHDDNELGSVEAHTELLERARAVGARLIESPPLEVESR